ncbi:MAG TPA: hypothetical protein P5075_10330 [Eubacteriales bacterium]|nr:hypothetical protein [Eubacteriales bacterium]
MKVCNYCNTQYDDTRTACPSCGSNAFDYICNNCHTRFDTGFCPTCGTPAGAQPRVCTNCGTKSFSAYCPSCGQALLPQKEPPQIVVVRQETQAERNRTIGMVVLTVFMPFVGAWILLFGRRYSKSLKLFALIYPSVMAAALFVQGAWETGLILLAPVAGYGVKLLVEKNGSFRQ